MSVRDRFKRTSRIFTKSSSDKSMPQAEKSLQAGGVTKPDAKKSGDSADAKASAVDKPASIRESLEGEADDGVKAEVQTEAPGIAAITPTEEVVEVPAQDKAADKVADKEKMIERRKSFFNRKPSLRAKESSTEEGSAKELNKLQRVLSRVKRQPRPVKESGKDKVAIVDEDRGDACAAKDAAKAQSPATSSSENISPQVLGNTRTDVEETAETT